MKIVFSLLVGVASLGVSAETFTLLIFEPEASYRERSNPKSPYWKDFSEYASGMEAAGILRGGTAFSTGSEVKSVKVGKSDTSLRDGVHSRQDDILGGYLSIDVPDMATAVAWAKKAPRSYSLHIEVRPSQPNPAMGMKN